MSGRNSPLYCTLTLITTQVLYLHRNRGKSYTRYYCMYTKTEANRTLGTVCTPKQRQIVHSVLYVHQNRGSVCTLGTVCTPGQRKCMYTRTEGVYVHSVPSHVFKELLITGLGSGSCSYWCIGVECVTFI